MLFIEAEGNNAPRFHVEFHPRVTVVSKLSPEMRARLAASLRAALFGDPVDLVMNVDVGGVPQELTHDLLARIGLQRRPLDNVISPEDLPGAIVRRQFVEEPAQQLTVGVMPMGGGEWDSYSGDDAQPAPAPLHDGPLFDARKELAEAEARAQEIADQLDAARSGPAAMPVDNSDALQSARARLAYAQNRVAELQAQIHELESAMPAPRESKIVRVMKLRQVEAEINERIHQLRGTLQAPAEGREEVQRAMEAAVAAPPMQDMGERRNRLELLSERFHEDATHLEKLEHQPRPPSWLVSQTQEQIDEAQARITAFSYQIKEGIDVRKQLARAQEQLREAQEAWDELENGIEGEVRTAQMHLEESKRNLLSFLGVDEDVDVDEAIENERAAMENVTDPRDALLDALARQNVDALPETAVDVAQRWLAYQERLDTNHAAVQQHLAAALLDLGDVRKQIADVSAEEETPERRSVDRTQLDAARAEHDSVVRDMDAIAVEIAELESAPPVASGSGANAAIVLDLELRHQAALEDVEAAGRKVDYFARLDALRHDDPVDVPQSNEVSTFSAFDAATSESEDEYGVPHGIRPWWEGGGESETPSYEDVVAANVPTSVEVDLSQINEEDVEMYVLSRAAGLRMAARGESVPLIIDAAFDKLAPHVVVRLFAALAKISAMVQVVYLSSGSVAEDWVKRQSEMIAAKVQVTPR